MKVIVVELAGPIHDDMYHSLLAVVSECKREKILRMRKRMDRERTLIGDILVRYCVLKALNIPAECQQFGITGHGKPYLLNHPEFHYNLSHSGRYVVIAVSSAPVGIDVEQISSLNLDIAQMCFSALEHSDLLSKPKELQINYFFDLWTIKESYLKLYGVGLSRPLKSFRVECHHTEIDMFRISGDPNCRVKQYEVDPGYKLSVCSLGDEFPEEAERMNCEQLCSRFLASYR
jgi:4'-phosphopantetheinyl transferase